MPSPSASRVLRSRKRRIAAWYRYNQGITDVANAVTKWDDASGAGRHYFKSAFGTSPTKQAGGAIQFNGTSDILRTAGFTLHQPLTIYTLMKQITWTFNDVILDGALVNTGVVQQSPNGSPPYLQMYSAGGFGNNNNNLTLNTYDVMCLVFNGRDSFMKIGNTAKTVDASVRSGLMDGLTLGSNANEATGVCSNIEVMEQLVVNGVDDDDTIATEMERLWTLAGITSNYSLTLTTPTAYQTFQRSGTTGTIQIAGTATRAGAVEASWNGGSYQRLASGGRPSARTFSGSIAAPQGQGTLTVRYVDQPSVTATAANVGIGDVYVIAGQSNASGKGTNNQSYSHATLKAALFNRSFAWANLTDPTDAPVSGSTGSVWPDVATTLLADQGIPVAFIPTALSGSSISQWQPGADHEDVSSLYGYMVRTARRVPGGVKAVLFWQGEIDAFNAVSQLTYSAACITFAAAVFADLGVKVMHAKLQNCAGINAGQQAAINAAIVANWGTGNFLTGPDLSGLNTDDSFHLMSDANLAAAGLLWAAKMELIP